MVDEQGLINASKSVMDNKEAYLQALKENGFHEGRTAKAIGLHRNTIWKWKHNDPAFRRICEELQVEMLDTNLDLMVDNLRAMLEGEEVKDNQVEGVRLVLRYLGYKRGLVPASAVRTDITSGGKPLEKVEVIFHVKDLPDDGH